MFHCTKMLFSRSAWKYIEPSLRFTYSRVESTSCGCLVNTTTRRYTNLPSHTTSLVCVRQSDSVDTHRHFSLSSSLGVAKISQVLDQQTAKELIQNTDAFLFDCDGVLWDTNGCIQGSPEAISRLKDLGKKVFYVSNNSAISRQTMVDKCHKFGFPASEEDAICTSYIAAEYLKQIAFDGKVFLVGREASMGEELRRVGVEFVGAGADLVQGSMEDWLKVTVDGKVKCVLVGFDEHFSYMKLLRAATHLRRPDCLYLVTNMDTNHATRSDVTVPSAGCMAVAVSHAARRKPLVLGKPEPLMFDVLQRAFDLDPARCLMVGDKLDTDVTFAQRCQIKSLLVLSGNTALGDFTTEKCAVVPDIYTNCLADILKFV